MKRLAALILLSISCGGCGTRKSYADVCGPLPMNWRTPRQGMGIFAIENKISVSSGPIIRWNGIVISQPTLYKYLSSVGQMNPPPVMHVTFSPELSCDTVEMFREAISSKLNCKEQVCAEGAGRMWIIGDVGGPGDGPNPPFDPAALDRNETPPPIE